MPDESSFSRANFSGNYGKARIVHDAKFQHRERHGVHLAPVDQIRVGQDRKWLLPQLIECFVHRKSLTAHTHLYPNFGILSSDREVSSILRKLRCLSDINIEFQIRGFELLLIKFAENPMVGSQISDISFVASGPNS